MTMFNYLTIEQAIKYITSHLGYEFSLENLQDLEAFQKIKPVFFFRGFAKYSYLDTFGTSEIGGYFELDDSESLISNEDIRFETCYLHEPTSDDYDSFSDVEVCLNLDKEARDSNSILKWVYGNDYVEINPYQYNFYLYHLDHYGNEIIKSIIKPRDVRIKKDQLDKWLASNTADDEIQKLQDRVSELEHLLRQTQTELKKNDGLMPNSEAKVSNLIFVLLSEHDYSLTQGGKGKTNQVLLEASIRHKTPLSENTLAYWLKKAYQIQLEQTQTGNLS